jgi:hypothetical protein
METEMLDGMDFRVSLKARVIVVGTFTLALSACGQPKVTPNDPSKTESLRLAPNGLSIGDEIAEADSPDSTATNDVAKVASADILTRNNEIMGYPRKSTVWRFIDGVDKTIPVCWKTPNFETEKGWVKAAVERSWVAHSGIRISGWGACNNEKRGIRISVEDNGHDNGPHTIGLGNELDKQDVGMVLNFTFRTWCAQSCRPIRQFYIETIAIHEFGHALSIAHEHNRPDTPGECQIRKKAQGPNGDVIGLTPYDSKSVMNYCTKPYGNNGNLTDSDVTTIQAMYCSPAQPKCHPRIFDVPPPNGNEI